MTAANLIVRDRAAYLLTDSATYSPDGVIVDLQPKVITSPKLRIAVSSAGDTWDAKRHIIQGLMDVVPSADEFVLALPQLMAVLKADLAAHYDRIGLKVDERAWPPQATFRLIVAIWSEERRRPEGYQTCSRYKLFNRQTECLIQPPHSDAGINAFSPEFDPERDGLALLEAQRQHADHYAGHIVGGMAQRTRVCEQGVSTIVLKHWPDEIGRKIDPSKGGA